MSELYTLTLQDKRALQNAEHDDKKRLDCMNELAERALEAGGIIDQATMMAVMHGVHDNSPRFHRGQELRLLKPLRERLKRIEKLRPTVGALMLAKETDYLYDAHVGVMLPARRTEHGLPTTPVNYDLDVYLDGSLVVQAYVESLATEADYDHEYDGHTRDSGAIKERHDVILRMERHPSSDTPTLEGHDELSGVAIGSIKAIRHLTDTSNAYLIEPVLDAHIRVSEYARDHGLLQSR